MSQQPATTQKDSLNQYLQKHAKPIVLLVGVMIVLIILFSPIIPVQSTTTETRTVNLLHGDQLYDKLVAGVDVGPYFVNVTNRDLVARNFSVTMNLWLNPLIVGNKQLQDTSVQTSVISAGGPHLFYIPSDWAVVAPMYSLTYSVTSPTKLEDYNVTKREYKSVITLIFGSM